MKINKNNNLNMMKNINHFGDIKSLNNIYKDEITSTFIEKKSSILKLIKNAQELNLQCKQTTSQLRDRT